MADFKDFEEKVSVVFADKELLKQAFTHRSYINENKNLNLAHNERLEFLGDAVLELIVTDFLFKKFPEKTEGELTAFRAALVNAQALSQVATILDVNDLLLLSKGETRDTGRARQYILANTMEAIIGAIYLDQGYGSAQTFVVTYVTPLLDEVIDTGTWIDAKSLFQEKAQESVGITPTYQLVKETGPDHDKHFTIGVFLNNEKIAQGEGNSKQEAEQVAARAALDARGW